MLRKARSLTKVKEIIMNIQELKNKLMTEKVHSLESLMQLLTVLRSPEGCPWDREQSHKSIRRDFIEETYEVVEAIDNDDSTLMCEELGDVMLQVAFHTEIEREKGNFTIEDVITGVVDKMILRHPHVFGDVKAETSEKVLSNWDKIKKEEKGRDTVASSMNSIPPSLPSLMQAQKLGKYAAKVGFDFPDTESAFAKITEESREVREALSSGDRMRIGEELGDLLFSVVNVCRKEGVDAEEALLRSNRKFADRFSALEKAVTDSGKDVSELQMEELDAIWEQNKDKLV